MINDPIFESVKRRWEEVMMVPPQRVGPLTPLYKRVIPLFKVHPWRVLVLAAGFIALGSYILLGPMLVRIVSLLQKGF